MKLAREVCLFALLIVLLSTAAVRAQEAVSLRGATSLASVAPPADFGTSSYAYTVIPASDFRPINSATPYTTDLSNGNLYRNAAGGGPSFFHWVDIPHGAILEDITYYVYDVDPANSVNVYFGISWRGSGTNVTPGWGNVAQGATSVSGQPGLTTIVLPYSNTMPALDFVNGQPNLSDISWFVVVDLPFNGPGFTSFNSVRLKWKRQVSPDPATARFNDVPVGHPFHRWIEALSAAGITGGCSATPPLYCPDQPVTRGQMAVFLATALGLHFVP